MKIKPILFLLVALVAISACNKKDDFNYAEGTVGSSTIVYYPAVTIKGDRLIILAQGATYTEPGVTSILNGSTAPFTTNGTVNTAVPGVYKLLYTAVNAQGYSASDYRTVVIIGTDVAANNFSGTYLRAATGVTSTWTKTATGVYTVENPGGAATGAGLTVIAVNYTGTKFSIPHQISADFGEVSSTTEAYTLTPAPPKYSFVFIAGGYGTGVRTFVKQ